MKRFGTVSVLLASLALGGCSLVGDDESDAVPTPVDTSTSVTDTTEAGFERYRATWERAGIVSYRFRFERICECLPPSGGPFDVTVRNGVITKVQYRGPGSDDDLGALGDYTVDDFFAILNDAFDTGADHVEGKYIPSLGLPVSIRIDYVAEVADEEAFLQITGFDSL